MVIDYLGQIREISAMSRSRASGPSYCLLQVSLNQLLCKSLRWAPGQDINIMFVGQSPEVLKAASVYFQSRLAAIPHVSNVADNLPYGKKS